MKKNDWFILISTCAYTYLFYAQSAGVNFFIFSILLVALNAALNTPSVKQLSWLAIVVGCILSGFAVFYLGTGLAVFANIVSLLLLTAFSINPGSSLFISLFHSLYSLLASTPYTIVRLTKVPEENPESKGPTGGKKLVLFMLPLFVVLVFFFLYRESNPLFKQITDQIDLDFISVDWLIFTLSGAILMSSFFYHRYVRVLKAADERNADTLGFVSEEDHQKSWVTAVMSHRSELFTGVSLFALLNLLLLSVNGVDIYYLYILQRLPNDLTLSEYLHDGTNALIFSIILAIGILMFYFRGRINFISDNRIIRLLAYGWIAQNIFLIITTAKRNWFYVSNFGLTHKRIGVYVFLGLCIIGLVTTFIKVYQVKSGWFLFRKNSWVWYSVLITACLINWDALIAKHNLTLAKEKHSQADSYYLGQLDYTSLSTLFEFYIAEKEENPATRSITPYLLLKMENQYKALTREINKADWQSSCLIKMRCKRKIDALIAARQLSFAGAN